MLVSRHWQKNMASRSKNNTPANTVVFVEGSMWDESLRAAVADTPSILQKVADFKKHKAENPMVSYGAGDRPFIGAGLFRQYLPKALKAHLTRDHSIIYELSGRNPTTIKLYGIFSHSDMGTGDTANKNLQKNLARRLGNSFNESVKAFLLKLLQE